MSTASARPVVSHELQRLKFEKQNQGLLRLPPNTTVQRRPLNHAPIASPYAGADVAKVVYISRKTPIMSAVKRVKKLLLHVEKRAMQRVDQAKDKHGTKKPGQASQQPVTHGEAVLLKASGRAMEQALRIADWFRNKENELECMVEVTTGSVQAVDDLVEVDEARTTTAREQDEADASEAVIEESKDSSGTTVTQQGTGLERAEQEVDNQEQANPSEGRNRRRAKRKRKAYAEDEVPEARIRWVKTIEVAISLKR